MNKVKLSVVVVTKDRAQSLVHCLSSILSNSDLPTEIVVIDNDSTDETSEIVRLISGQTDIRVKCFFSKKEGYPAVYNYGLKKAQYDWVAFIDDDCIASKDWIREIKRSIKTYHNTSAVMGWCSTYFSQNLYSLATLILNNQWKKLGITSNRVEDLSILDSKNIVYNKKFLQEKNISFDESRVRYERGAAQDIDLGLQIQQAGGDAFVNHKMMIWHKDPTSWWVFIKKNISSWKAVKSLDLKWDMSKQQRYRSSSESFKRIIDKYGNDFDLSPMRRLGLALIVKQAGLVRKLLSVMGAGDLKF